MSSDQKMYFLVMDGVGNQDIAKRGLSDALSLGEIALSRKSTSKITIDDSTITGDIRLLLLLVSVEKVLVVG